MPFEFCNRNPFLSFSIVICICYIITVTIFYYDSHRTNPHFLRYYLINDIYNNKIEKLDSPFIDASYYILSTFSTAECHITPNSKYGKIWSNCLQILILFFTFKVFNNK